MSVSKKMNKLLDMATSALGSIPAVLLATLIVSSWLLGGLVFGFTDTYQLIINTGTTIITFLMVFVVQHTQNRDGRAIQTKLDAILAAIDEIPDELMGIENKPEKEIKKIQKNLKNQL